MVNKKVVSGKGTSMVKWDEKFAAMAKKSAKIVSGIGGDSNFIKLQGGQLQYQGAAVPGNSMDVVIIDHVLVNMLYKDKFDSNNPTSPICFAFGETVEEMVPPKEAHEPQNDGEGCATCPNNEWGTADTGRGKRCKNSVRLAMISIEDLKDIPEAEVAFMHVPVTSVKLWAGYVRMLDDTHHRPSLGVVTRITVVPDKDTQFKVKFDFVELTEDNEQIAALFAKYEQVNQTIRFPFVFVESENKPVASGKARKFAALAGKGRK